MGDTYQFPQTRWTFIGQLQNGTEKEKEVVWDWVSRHYWSPIYSFLRASGREHQVAEDLTQQFFEKLLTENILEKARFEQGKLRSFLLGALKHMVSNQDRSGRTQKRGEGGKDLSIDTTNFELIYGEDFCHKEDPEKIYQRCWALALIETAEGQLRKEFAEEGRQELFGELEPYLRNEDLKPSYDELAAKLESTPGAVRLLVHRLRKRLRQLVEEEVGQTLTEASEVTSECEWIQETLRRDR